MSDSLREALAIAEEARDLLLERIQGSPARSAAHNARVRIDSLIAHLRASTDATPHYHQSPLMTENGAGRASTDAAPVAGEGLPALLEPTVELARRNIMREQTDFIGRMHQAMGGYEVACEEWADGEGDDAGRDDAAENLTELIGLALAQLAMVCNPTDPLAALSHPPATDTLVAMERRILAAECASQRILNDLADECERAEVKSELEWLVSLAKDSVETAHAVKEIDASAAKVIAALSHPPATDTAQAEPGLSAAEAWQDLVDKDDRTSPEEYPDMALITREELADYMQAAHAQAEPVGRDWFPILGSQGQRIDYQLVADHGQQAQSNHYQTVKRLKERGGLSWCELYAVLHNRKYEKIDVNDAMIACRALEARYLAALSTPPARTDDELEALYDRIHREELAKGGRMGEIRLRVVRRFNIAAALPKEPKQ